MPTGGDFGQCQLHIADRRQQQDLTWKLSYETTMELQARAAVHAVIYINRRTTLQRSWLTFSDSLLNKGPDIFCRWHCVEISERDAQKERTELSRQSIRPFGFESEQGDGRKVKSHNDNTNTNTK